MSHTIREDQYGPYVRCNGYVFRPLFPVDYPPHPNKTRFATGERTSCEHHLHTPLCVVKTLKHHETWFSHGRYIRPRGSFKSSTECYKPEGFTWQKVKEHARA